MGEMILVGEAAERMGVPEWKLTYLRVRGLVPEFARVGRFHLLRADQIDGIRDRLVQSGHIRPKQVVKSAS